MPRLSIDDCAIHYTDSGTPGPAVLLLHGYPETHLTWRHTVAALAPDFRVVAPDLRGFGASAARPPFTLDRLVDDALALLAALGLARAHVVGHDWGAVVAMHLARRHPERVASLVTVNFAARRFVLRRAPHIVFFAIPLLPEVVLRVAPRAFTRALLRAWSRDFAAGFPPAVLEAYLDAVNPAATLGYYRGALRRVLRRRGPRGPRAPEVPWRAIWSDADPVSPPANLRMFREDFPEVPVDVIAGAGHFPQEERPQAFNQILLAWLRATLNRRPP